MVRQEAGNRAGGGRGGAGGAPDPAEDGGQCWAARTGIGGMGREAGRSGSRAHQNLMPERFFGACSGTRPRPSHWALILTAIVADVARDIAQRRGRARAKKYIFVFAQYRYTYVRKITPNGAQ